ncbi:hypothetical protein HYPBUDRAFT_148114 [Hyphopichia burtonii NRRL Y-1933]|uniref:DASH complex subunit SPC19 n=1 Tax=Hyphopichia burtonii NRRL Y-1933 TaxID=984485 RepID=A0A1E4RKK4_9ASCO|nr:hypothetical protein HYPBUDRAFT_148114 [Hyphopichia burtonii NRRL Y-1933]ODV67808.1 hypothetical protein HYPBUDRAFT_148114 [Hyphopichia burtonii NRRL Y-1933]
MAAASYGKNETLESCVESLKGSVEFLEVSLKRLDEVTRDVPRLKRVLTTDKVFGLVPELDLENAKKKLQHETHPQINIMVEKIEREISRLTRRKNNLTGKIELQRIRIDGARKNTSNDMEIGRVVKGDINEHKLTRLKLLQNKKERLKYSLSRLNLQDKKNRLSMIPSLPPQ